MKILARRYQDAVYWSPKGIDDQGNPTWNEPIQLNKVRWEEIREVTKNSRGEEKVSKARVMTGQDVEEGGILWQGLLANLISTSEPFKNDGAWQIFGFTKVPTIRPKSDKDYLRVAYL